ncbi:glycoside hydrolase domain-containing protein [Actinoplanes sp. NBRC 101535]|uniref:glycoside hydrolase domain-containing protein n=1 Tax=Actinoplanes sp. NBRC 101535 TaxID=3032196 RepID=UPI0024A39E51|nr:glycoside hydrolase domain-containing protein [Actinoplanes sp. NBRC 101535]GLY05321.1 hypothetical protein Acsp01_57000 [Actinoplanes sp. NBRC 101535]
MAVTILPRSTWAPYAAGRERSPGHAAAPPSWNTNRSWNPSLGGVFIHHRGGDLPIVKGGYDTEEDCLADIASVYEDHWQDEEKFDLDIAYNFLICPHGNVYEGRGYIRGEANHAGKVGEIGRNEGFYSICGLLRSSDDPTVAMLRSYRDLIDHLRNAAPAPAGSMILPHSHEYATECPGALSMYARPGSTIDPNSSWRGPGDRYVYEAQKWVNRTYKGVAPGYIEVVESGYTGWPTVLSLTQGLQHELGISPTVQNFGPGTFAAVANRNKLPREETNPRIQGLVNAALWAKGYWTSRDIGLWNAESDDALLKLYTDAGLSISNRAMWPHVARSLMRMDQFKQVPGGSSAIRGIQQRLNARYVAQVGIPAMSLVPCDGIYSRDVQSGFMMAVQYELGLSPAGINGYFGPATQTALKGKGSQALTGDLRYLFRAACLFNSPVPDPFKAYDPEDLRFDAETQSHLDWLLAFQKFSQLPTTMRNDYATWAQLLVSSGDTERPASGCDGITEITTARAQALLAKGYRIVGRYLDEHLPADDPYYLGKALKTGEPATILAAGMRFFPIFQYNGTVLANFTYDKGYAQGLKGHDKAVEHRIPAGTCVYYAVDYDALDVDIDSGIKPYFEGVRQAFADRGGRYTFGVYGSRNVCIRITREVGAKWSLVSGMSWGYSGNLGFPLPENWSFNQIREYDFQAGWGLDHDVWRDNGDPGVSRLVAE